MTMTHHDERSPAAESNSAFSASAVSCDSNGTSPHQIRPRAEQLHARLLPEARGLRGAEEGARRWSRTTVIELVKASGLRGRGGAGFPTGMKWQFVDKKTEPRYIACNADESEPGTFKDHVLMERNPHLLFEGCLIGCWAIGAKVAYIYIRGEFFHVQQVMEAELAKAYAQGYVGKNILGRGFDCDIVDPPRRRRLRSRRRDRADRIARRQARAAAHQAAVSGRRRALQQADRGQQRRDALQPAADHDSTAPSGSRRSGPRRTAARSCSASAAT